MSPDFVRVNGHYCNNGTRYDGLITFSAGHKPEVFEVDGTLYQKVHRPEGYMNPEMHMQKETR